MCFWGYGRSGRGNGSGTYGEGKELNTLQRQAKQEILISECQNERKNPTQLHLAWGLLWMWDFLFYSALWPIFHSAKLWEDEVWNPAGKGGIKLFSPVAQHLRLPATHWVSASVYCHKTLGRVSLKERSPVIPPLSHRVSLKVQVK